MRPLPAQHHGPSSLQIERAQFRRCRGILQREVSYKFRVASFGFQGSFGSPLWFFLRFWASFKIGG